jgi:peptidoglycan/LPS O-acetylase OafA/YrhL
MEGLRGLAVTMVFFVHYHAVFGGWLPRPSASFDLSYLLSNIGLSGVDLFFVLSGYLIYGAVIRRAAPYWKFVARRVERIYPTFLIVLITYLVLSVIFPERSKMPGSLLAALVYVGQNVLLLPGIFNIEPIIVVAWSLSYEFFFYLTIPCVVMALRMRAWTAQARVVFLVVAAAAYLAYCLGHPYNHARLVMFAGGMVIYELRQRGWGARPSPRYDVLVLAILLGAFALVHQVDRAEISPAWSYAQQLGAYVRILVLAIVFPLFSMACFVSKGPLRAMFSWRPIRWLGNMSYSYYLLHGLALHGASLVLHRAFAPDVPHPSMYWIALPLLFGWTLAASAVLFITIEQPLSLAGALTKRPHPGARPHVAAVAAENPPQGAPTS